MKVAAAVYLSEDGTDRQGWHRIVGIGRLSIHLAGPPLPSTRLFATREMTNWRASFVWPRRFMFEVVWR